MFDIEKIKEDFSKVIRHNFSTTPEGLEASVNHAFERWQVNKKRFINAFGGELTYITKEKVSISISREEKHEKINQFVSDIREILCVDINNFFTLMDIMSKLSDFIYDYMSTKDFFDNHVTIYYNEKIPAGARVSKAFKIILNDYSLPDKLITEIQNLYSRYIQESQISGYLVLSVHPMDFLSVSENTYKWRSCHAMDGDYALGNIQYMEDKVTFIGYVVKDDKKYCLPNFPIDVRWNSKIARQLFFLHDEEDILVCGRPYPYENKPLTNKFISLIEEMLMKPDPDRELYYNTDLDYRFPSKNFYNPEMEKPLYFNDLIDSSCYEPYIFFNSGQYFDKEKQLKRDFYPRFLIGEDIPCLMCGKHPATDYTGKCDNCWVDGDDDDDDDYVMVSDEDEDGYASFDFV